MKNRLLSKLQSHLAAQAANLSVSDVRIGLGYTAVRLSDDSTGVAYTFRDKLQHGCTAFQDAGTLAGRKANDLLNFLEADSFLDTAVGLAAANALANRPQTGLSGGDILENIGLKPEDHVGMVGNFAPIVSALEKRVAKLTIFEDAEVSGPLFQPAHSATDILPRCQVAFITSTTLINRTIDGLLKAAEKCREVVMLGPSTPLCPVVFSSTPVTQLSGIIIKDAAPVLRAISEGGGTRRFIGFADKVNLPV